MRDFPPTFQSISRQMDTGRKLDNYDFSILSGSFSSPQVRDWRTVDLTGNWNSGSNLCISRSYPIGRHPHTVRFQATFYIFLHICLKIFGWILKIFWPDFWRHFDWIFDGFFKILWPVTVEVNIGKCPAVFPTERFLKSTLHQQSTHTYTNYKYKLFPQFYY